MDIWLKLVLPQWNNAMYMRCKVHYQEEVQWHQKITIQDYATKYITTVQPQRLSTVGVWSDLPVRVSFSTICKLSHTHGVLK